MPGEPGGEGSFDVTGNSAVSLVGRLAGLAAVILLQTYWFLQPVPFAAKTVAVVFVALVITKPAYGLLVFAGLAPLSTPLANLCGGGAGLGAQLLEQMALGVGAGVLLRGWATDSRTRIGATALFMAAVAVASAVVMIPAAAAPIVPSPWDGQLLHQLAVRETTLTSPIWTPLFAALVIAECGLLGWAVERTVRREPVLATRLVFIALVGHAGAAMLNFLALLGEALRTGQVLKALPELLAHMRFSMQTDWNASASALLLAGVAGIGLMGKPEYRRAGIGLLLLLVALGLWITGSRIALAMGVVSIIALTGWSAARAGRRGRFMAIGAAVLLIAAGVWLNARNPSGRNIPISRSIGGRLEMARVGLRIFEQAPIFGIGIARFYGASADFIGPTPVNTAPRENAHNNFIQVLAEQGLVGLSALLWLLAVILVSGTRAQIARPDAVRGSLLLALVACIGTWLTGHPLLVPEFAFVFWLYCGVLTGLTPTVIAAGPPRLVLALLAGVILSVPSRASAMRDNAELEHLGFGVSALWQHDDTQRYREAGTSFALYLPATGRPVAVPIRRAPGAPDPLVVDVRIGERLTDRISVAGETWQTLLVTMQQRSRRFELVDFSVHAPTSSTAMPVVLVRVGKALPR